MQNKMKGECNIGVPQYYGNYIVIYVSTYKELRCIIITANNDKECEDIIEARGLHSLAYFEAPEFITLFKKKKRKDKN